MQVIMAKLGLVVETEVRKVPLLFSFILKSSHIQPNILTSKRTTPFCFNLSGGGPDLIHYSYFFFFSWQSPA